MSLEHRLPKRLQNQSAKVTVDSVLDRLRNTTGRHTDHAYGDTQAAAQNKVRSQLL